MTKPKVHIIVPAMLNLLFSRINLLIAALVFMAMATPAGAQNIHDRGAAVIFDYQRVDEDLSPATNTTLEQFTAHLDELTDGAYYLATLDEITGALARADKLPDRTVAITFDGAYKSAMQNAIPLLLAKNIPFTVFFSPDQADANTPDYMNWDDIKKLARNPRVTLGLHTADYTRLADAGPEEMRRQINTALARYREVLKAEPAYFAYPFGEYNKAYRTMIAESGFRAAFGQQSGVAYDGSDMMVLPRFAMTENYSDDERFRMIAAALPLPVTDISPEEPRITAPNPPTFGFTIDQSIAEKIPLMSCYVSEQGKPQIQVISKTRVELRVTKAFDADRVRVNCTMPGPKPKVGEDQRWRWLGMLLTVAHGTPDDDINTDAMDNSRPD
ncbi:MAG: polysaccharide deacetylase family protein [Micavibrio sp.]|nr:polysaccharide deacetylase family protein [Micavibrio sp.]